MDNEKFREKKEEYLRNLQEAKTTGMKFTSVSGEDVKALYTPDDLNDLNYLEGNG